MAYMCTEKHGVKVGLVDRGMAPLGGFVDEGLWEVDEGLWECFGWFCGGRVARGMVVFSRSYLAIALRANVRSTLALAPCPRCYKLSGMEMQMQVLALPACPPCAWACMCVEGPRSLVHGP